MDTNSNFSAKSKIVFRNIEIAAQIQLYLLNHVSSVEFNCINEAQIAQILEDIRKLSIYILDSCHPRASTSPLLATYSNKPKSFQEENSNVYLPNDGRLILDVTEQPPRQPFDRLLEKIASPVQSRVCYQSNTGKASSKKKTKLKSFVGKEVSAKAINTMEITDCSFISDSTLSDVLCEEADPSESRFTESGFRRTLFSDDGSEFQPGDSSRTDSSTMEETRLFSLLRSVSKEEWKSVRNSSDFMSTSLLFHQSRMGGDRGTTLQSNGAERRNVRNYVPDQNESISPDQERSSLVDEADLANRDPSTQNNEYESISRSERLMFESFKVQSPDDADDDLVIYDNDDSDAPKGEEQLETNDSSSVNPKINNLSSICKDDDQLLKDCMGFLQSEWNKCTAQNNLGQRSLLDKKRLAKGGSQNTEVDEAHRLGAEAVEEHRGSPLSTSPPSRSPFKHPLPPNKFGLKLSMELAIKGKSDLKNNNWR